MILAIKTDQPEAELYLIDQDGKVAAQYRWLAGRSLADTIISKINQFLASNQLAKKNLTGLAVFSGSGSFTGLRIGTAMVNALAYNLKIPVVKADGHDWLGKIVPMLASARVGDYITPDYDGEPNITQAKS